MTAFSPNPTDDDPELAPWRAIVPDMRGAIVDGDRRWLTRALIKLHPADAADALEQLPRDVFEGAVELLGEHLPSDVLIELKDPFRGIAINAMENLPLAQALDALESDDAAALFHDIEEADRTDILAAVSAPARANLEQSITHEDETAGRLMQREFIAAPSHWTVEHALNFIRVNAEDLPERFYEIYVVDPAFHLIGVVQVASLLRVTLTLTMEDIMEPLLSDIRVGMDQEDVAHQFRKYALASAPIRDEDGRIKGMITVDDMVNVIQEEHAEDLLALSNVSAHATGISVFQNVGARAPWLGINLLTAFAVSGLISVFEEVLTQVVALAILMPIVAALGGNAGAQGLAVAVRAMAERELDSKESRRAVWREFATAFINGAIFAMSVGGISYVWFHDIKLTAVMAAAMFVTFIWAGLSGILVPLTLRRLGADPAVASSVFVLTLTDMAAFFSFLGLSTLILL